MFLLLPVLKRILYTFFSILTAIVADAQVYSVSGTVVDAGSGQPLAFVNIVANSQRQGAISDIDGKFKLSTNEPITNVTFSYVGYKQLSYPIGNTSLALYIKMISTSYELKEVVVLPGENPAHRIINKATANKQHNDPEKLNSFSYTAYNKMIFTADYDSAYIKDLSRRSELDSSDIRALDFFDKRHLMIMEFVSEKKFMAPELSNEKVIASRVSGLQNPGFTQLATQMQSFSFYPDYIKIYNKSYLNPISKGSTNKYLFILKDTAFSGADTVFIISYRPKRGRKFDALKGLLYINTNGYAIQNVIAEPVNVSDDGIDVKIQQKYELVDGKHWFPVQLNTDNIYMMLEINDDRKVIGLGRSYLKDIKINPVLDKKEFGVVELQIANDAAGKTDEFWENNRSDTLNEKEKETYHFIDSLGKAENLDLKIKVLESILLGKIPLRYIDIDLERFITFNDYEGFRLGAGIQTSRRISRVFSVGGYWAYGTRDKRMKYGGDLAINFHRKSELRLRFSYINDVIETGGTFLSFDHKPFSSTERYRDFMIEKMDSIVKVEAVLNFRALKYLSVELSANEQYRKITDDYYFSSSLSDEDTLMKNSFVFTELVVGFRYAFREKLMELSGRKFSLGTKYPIIWGKVTKGFNNILNGQFDYIRFDLKIQKSFLTRGFGRPSFQLAAGYVVGDLPYTMLFNGKGTYKNFGLWAEYNFETMGVNEFLSDSYVSLFYSHSLGKLFHTKKMQPELVLEHNMGIGNLSNEEQYRDITFKTMEHGYFESGLMLRNIYKINIMKLGVGAYYRYGAYTHSKALDNLAVKIAIIFG